MMKLKVCYLEDDLEMHQLVVENLSENFECTMVTSIDEAKALLDKDHFHIILVDLNLGDESGFDFIHYLKTKEFTFIPSILIITDSNSEDDEMRSHESDVFEYIHKPLKPKILKAQLEKYVRRFETIRSFKKMGPLQIDEQKMEVRMLVDSKEENILLTLKEYKLLNRLINSPGRTYTREQLFVEVWNGSSEVQSRTIDMHVSALRKKLGPYGGAISSIRGVGYTFDLVSLDSKLP